MNSDLILTAAGATVAETAMLAALALVFNRMAPARFLKERHDLAVAVIFLTPVLFLLTFTPSSVGDSQGLALGWGANAASDPYPARPETVGAPLSPTAGAVAAPTGAAPPPTTAKVPAGLATAFVSLWIVGAVFMLARLARDARLFARLRAGATPARPPSGIVLSRAIEIRLSPAIASPMLGGVFRPVILLPDDFPLDAAAAPVLEHEIAHWRRRDPHIELAARVVTAIFWWAGPLYFLRPMIVRSREALCDAQAAQRTGAPERLAAALVDVAERALIAKGGPALSLPVASRGSALADRLRRLVDGEALKARRAVANLPAILAGLSLLSVLWAPQVGSAGPLEISFLEGETALALAQTRGATAADDALYRAARRGDEDSVKRLLAEGADPNGRAPGDGTPLIGAVRSGEAKIVRRLLDAGADPNIVSPGDGAPLIAAARRGEREMVRMLLDAGADPDRGASGDGAPLIAAAGAGEIQILELLLKAGADPDIAVPRDGNPLIAAALRGETEVVRRLIAAGADPDGYVFRDETPLINAVQAGHIDVAEILVAAGADVSLTVKTPIDDPGGPYRSPLSEAERKGRDEMVRWLKTRGAEHQPPKD